jgi:hypothetical protein
VLKVTEENFEMAHDVYTNRRVDKKMVHMSIIEARLSQLGFKASRWFKPEIKELQYILWENERIVECAQGRYFGGFALLVATDHRLLLIDKKIPYLSVEDIRYDMISEINYSSQILDSTINIYTVNKQHRFNSWKHKIQLRKLVTYAQQRVMEVRQYQQQGPQEVSQPTQQHVPTMMQAYNYGQRLQLGPPNITTAIRNRMPSPHVPRVVGAAALHGSRRWINPNPYIGGSLVTRKQMSNTSPSPYGA